MVYAKKLREFEKRYLKKLLSMPHKSIRELIRLSEMSSATFYAMLERNNIKLPEYGTPERPRIDTFHMKDKHDPSTRSGL